MRTIKQDQWQPGSHEEGYERVIRAQRPSGKGVTLGTRQAEAATWTLITPHAGSLPSCQHSEEQKPPQKPAAAGSPHRPSAE